MNRFQQAIDSLKVQPATREFESRVPEATDGDPAKCQYRVPIQVTLRPVIGISVAMGPPQVRCRLQTRAQRNNETALATIRTSPVHSPWTLGACTPKRCPLAQPNKTGTMFIPWQKLIVCPLEATRAPLE